MATVAEKENPAVAGGGGGAAGAGSRKLSRKEMMEQWKAQRAKGGPVKAQHARTALKTTT